MSLDPSTVLLCLLAGVFVATSGANDGAAIISMRLRTHGAHPGAAVATLTLAVVAVPALLGAQTAEVLRRAAGDGSAPLVAIGSATAVTAWLLHRGISTSLTLALVGGLAGTALGSARAVPWDLLARAVVLGLAAPVAGAAFAWVLVRLLARARALRPGSAWLRMGSGATFGATCLAYAGNDGQKSLAVAALAAAALSGEAGFGGTPVLLLVGVVFGVGAAVGVTRQRVGVTRLRAVDTLAAETGSALAVLGSTFGGAPVSMTQSLTGAEIGTTAARGGRSVRWGVAGSMAGAWLTTLPATTAVAAMVSALLGAR